MGREGLRERMARYWRKRFRMDRDGWEWNASIKRDERNSAGRVSEGMDMNGTCGIGNVGMEG